MSSREQIKQYLLSKGLPELQVQGILLNIEDESGFSANPPGPNDAGNSYGLFQHNGPRKRALFKHAGSTSPSWQQQVDYALTEPDMANYLQGSYSNVGDAAVGFLDRFERPAKKHRDDRAAKYRSQYGHWTPSGGAVDMATVTPGPAYQNQGTVAPVSMDGIPTRDRPGGAPMNANDDISRALARLEQIRNGLAAPPQQPQMDPWAALGAMGAGILAGGQGHGNWFGRGMNNVMQMQAAQQMQMPQPMTPLEQLKAEGELSKMRADLMQRQATRRFRESLTPEEQLLHDAAGGQVMAQAKARELVKQKFGAGPAGTQKMQEVRFMVEQGISMEEAMQRVGLGPADTAVDVDKLSSRANTLRDDYTRETAPHQTVLERYDAVKDYTPAEMTGVEDWSLMISLGRALDPSSTMQQGEMEVLQGLAAGQGPFAYGARKLMSGQQLNLDERGQMLSELEQRAKAAHKRSRQAFESYGKRAGELSVPHALVTGETFPDFTPRASAQVVPPGPGEQARKVMNGKTYVKKDGQWYEL